MVLRVSTIKGVDCTDRDSILGKKGWNFDIQKRGVVPWDGGDSRVDHVNYNNNLDP